MVPPLLSVGTLSGGAVTSELVEPVSTGTPVELVPPGRATTSVGVGVSKALLHQHPHTVGTVVAAGESPAAGTHAHAHASHCLQQSPYLRVSKHAHAPPPLDCPPHAAPPRVGVGEDIGGQCALSTLAARGGWGASLAQESPSPTPSPAATPLVERARSTHVSSPTGRARSVAVSTSVVGARPALSAPLLRGESPAAAFAPAAEARPAVATVPAAGTSASATSVHATGTRLTTTSTTGKNQKRALRRARARSIVLCARRSQRQVPRPIPTSRWVRRGDGPHLDPATSLRGSGEEALILVSVPSTLDDEETSPFPLPLHVMVGQQKVDTSRLLNPQPVCASR